MTKINYSREFIEECKCVYPNFTHLHTALKSGHQCVGEYLDIFDKYLCIEEIISPNATLDLLQTKALLVQRKSKLYSEWYGNYGYIFNQL